MEAGNPLGGSLSSFKHPWITWLLDEQEPSCWTSRSSLQSPKQPCGWFFDVTWPKEMEEAASRPAWFKKPTLRTGHSPGQHASGIPTQSFTSFAAVCNSLSHPPHQCFLVLQPSHRSHLLLSKKTTTWPMKQPTLYERQQFSSSPRWVSTHTFTPFLPGRQPYLLFHPTKSFWCRKCRHNRRREKRSCHFPT